MYRYIYTQIIIFLRYLLFHLLTLFQIIFPLLKGTLHLVSSYRMESIDIVKMFSLQNELYSSYFFQYARKFLYHLKEGN